MEDHASQSSSTSCNSSASSSSSFPAINVGASTSGGGSKTPLLSKASTSKAITIVRRTETQDETLARELNFLILRYLESSSCSESATVLARELESKALLPQKFDWVTGN